MDEEEILLLATELIEDRDVQTTGDAKWYTEELDLDWETQSAVYDEVVKRLGLA